MTFLTRFLGATLLAAASLASHAQAPQPPEIAAKSYLLVDVTAGQRAQLVLPDGGKSRQDLSTCIQQKDAIARGHCNL